MNIELNYDSNNNLTTSIDPLLQTTTFTWDYGHQLNTVRDQLGNTTRYTRNALGQVSVVLSPSVNTTTNYDTSHRRTTVIDSRGNKTLSYSYSPGGLLNYLQDSDGNRTDYLYDSIGQLSGIWAANYDYVSFAYDAGGRLIEKMFSSGADSRTTYNPDNSLASLTNKHGLTTLSSHVYSYDALGNRSTQTETVGATLTNYTYGYDALNRLTATSQTGQPSQSYSYDDQGRRISKTVGTTTTNFLYNDADILAEYGTTWGLPTAQYTHGARIDDTLIRATATTAQYFHEDGLGSVVGITNAAGGTDATQR